MALPAPDDNNATVTLWGYIVAGASALGGAGLVFWRWFINNRLSDTATNAQLQVIQMLQDQLTAERQRADLAMQARDAALDTIRQLKDQVAQLTSEVHSLKNAVQATTTAVQAATTAVQVNTASHTP